MTHRHTIMLHVVMHVDGEARLGRASGRAVAALAAIPGVAKVNAIDGDCGDTLLGDFGEQHGEPVQNADGTWPCGSGKQPCQCYA